MLIARLVVQSICATFHGTCLTEGAKFMTAPYIRTAVLGSCSLLIAMGTVG